MKVALIGYGKMGKTIEQVLNDLGDTVVLKIGESNKEELTAANLQKADVAIEFTRPDSAVENIQKCLDAGVPVVVGTTAWLEHLPAVKQACTAANGAVFYSPNFSIGVNIFWEVNRRLAELMDKQPQYEVTMWESHHTEKLDAPSGTAVKTAEVIMEVLERKSDWATQTEGTVPQAQVKKEKAALHAEDLLIVAKREPGVPGTHVVTYTSNVDVLEFKHEAKSRRGFAEGAVMAARWLIGKKGVFEMKDMLQ